MCGNDECFQFAQQWNIWAVSGTGPTVPTSAADGSAWEWTEHQHGSFHDDRQTSGKMFVFIKSNVKIIQVSFSGRKRNFCSTKIGFNASQVASAGQSGNDRFVSSLLDGPQKTVPDFGSWFRLFHSSEQQSQRGLRFVGVQKRHCNISQFHWFGQVHRCSLLALFLSNHRRFSGNQRHIFYHISDFNSSLLSMATCNSVPVGFCITQ